MATTAPMTHGTGMGPTQHAQRQLAPAGTGTQPLPSGVKMETYENASPEIKGIVRQLNRLACATTMDDHTIALRDFDDDVIFDTPFIQIQGRERVRALSSLFKQFVGTLQIEPKLITISVPPGATTKGGMLDVDGLLHFMPHRPWYLPITYLLPKDIPIYSTVSVFIKHNDKVYKVTGKNHNLPHVPRLVRIVAGYVVSLAVGIAEPAYNSLRDWYRAGVEQVSETNASLREVASNVAGTVRETATQAVDTAGKAVAGTGGTPMAHPTTTTM